MRDNSSNDYSFESQSLALSSLETFDPLAFQGDRVVSQHTCNFVLALALAFNDLRDIFYAHIALQGSKPDGPIHTRTRAVGLYSGMNIHLLRLIMGTVHELLNVIRDKDAMGAAFNQLTGETVVSCKFFRRFR
mgnify:CR=1 FL=1